jgi:membrane protease YdiL (CAAX protease family)
VLIRLLICLGALSACSRPIAQARTSKIEPPSVREVDARERIENKRCSGSWAYLPLVLGLGQYCHRKDGEAAVMAIAGAVELTTGVLVGRRSEAGFDHPGSTLPLVAFQDTWVIGVADMLVDRDLARRELYAPTDTLPDMVAAPFNIEVMKDPKVWVGLAVALAVGIGASLALEGDVPEVEAGEDVNVFGRQMPPSLGYPAASLAYGALFSHVATAEELLFRGVIQSELARRHGETLGWIEGSLIFGAIHAPNAWTLPEEQRRDYLVYGLPVITAIGGYLGYLYKDSGYSLAPPAAVHFWYDFLLSATFFIIEPQDSPLSANLSLTF